MADKNNCEFCRISDNALNKPREKTGDMDKLAKNNSINTGIKPGIESIIFRKFKWLKK